eukprot:2602583-Prymnesium_polylepis.1
MSWTWGGRVMRRSWGTKRGGMMQGGGKVQAGPSGPATPACGARGVKLPISVALPRTVNG